MVIQTVVISGETGLVTPAQSSLQNKQRNKKLRKKSFVLKFPGNQDTTMLGYLLAIVIVSSCLGPALSHDHESHNDQCASITNSAFKMCTKAGYNYTLPFPKDLTERGIQTTAYALSRLLSGMENCSQNALAEVMGCSFMIPKCSHGKRAYPCKRVCGEFLKQCEKDVPEIALDYIVALCHVLPNDSCFEPENFSTNDSVPGPLDRGCQELILPACKNLGVYNHTLISIRQQKNIYKRFYGKEYDKDNLENEFPKMVQMQLARHPKCQENIKKMFCGEAVPPCFPREGAGLYSLCRSVCDGIVKDCPEFFKNNFIDAEFCGLLANGSTGHGFCKRTEWPPPFSWLRYMPNRRRGGGGNRSKPTPGSNSTGTKTWVIAVAVVVPLVIVALFLAAVIWWKWRRASGVGYKKHTDGDDTAPLET